MSVPRSPPPLRILLVDDSWEVLRSAARFLTPEPNLEVAGCASSGAEALEKVALLRPDLVLMDLAMPGMSGLAATRQIKALSEGPRVILLTADGHEEYRTAVQKAGADGFVTKFDFGTGLLPLIHLLFGLVAPPADTR